MFLTSIISQYAFETVAFTSLAFVALIPAMRNREPRRAFIALAALNVLRFGGVAGALAAIATSPSPAFLVEVAIGDGAAAALAVASLVLLLRRSEKARSAFLTMNVVGLLGIVVSETWLECLDLGGHLVRTARLHGPTVGAAIYSALHVLAFALVARHARGVGPTPSRSVAF